MVHIREVQHGDLLQLLTLYSFLPDNPMPLLSDEIEKIWCRIVSGSDHHLIVGLENEAIISSCVLIIVPNLTHEQRPYALIENVITHPDYRSRGYATQILNYAKVIAAEQQCYKIMLMAGSKRDSTLNFYKRAGYNLDDKTAFVQWLE